MDTVTIMGETEECGMRTLIDMKIKNGAILIMTKIPRISIKIESGIPDVPFVDEKTKATYYELQILPEDKIENVYSKVRLIALQLSIWLTNEV